MLQSMSPRDSKSSKNLQLIRLFIQSKQYDLAEKHLFEYMNKNADCPEALKLMAQILEARGEVEGAVQCYQKSLNIKQQLQTPHNSSYDFSASPINNLSSLNRNSNSFLNMPLNSTLDTSQTMQLNGNHSSDAVKIDYQEIERLIDSRLQPLNDCIQSLQKLVQDLQISSTQILAAQDKNSSNFSRQINDSLSTFKGLIVPIESSVRSLDSKHLKTIETLNTLKSEMECLSNVVQEGLDRSDEEDEEYDDYEDENTVSPPASSSTGPKPNLSALFKKPSNDWKCSTCDTSNDEDQPKCVCCEENNPNTKFAPAKAVTASKFSFGVQPQGLPAAGQSFVVPPVNSSTSTSQLVPKTITPPKASFSFGQSASTPVFNFGPVSASSNLFGSTPTNGFGSPAANFTKTAETKSSPFSGNNHGNFFKPQENAPLAFQVSSETDSKESDTQFVAKAEPTTGQLKNVTAPNLPINFSLQDSKKGCNDSDVISKDVFNTNTQTKDPSGGGLFSSLVDNLGIKPATVDNINTSQGSENVTGDDGEHVVNTDYTSAKSKLLPQNFIVTTGEENDDELFSERSKLFRLDNDEYKERGLGQMKILKNKQNGFIRLLMRREQVHKVVCNHGIKNVNVQVHKTLNRAVNWVARDHSESSEGTDEVFLLKFKNEEQAKAFVDKVHELQATL